MMDRKSHYKSRARKRSAVTPRLLDVCKLIALGNQAKDVAELLSISKMTVYGHIYRAKKLTNTKTIPALVYHLAKADLI